MICSAITSLDGLEEHLVEVRDPKGHGGNVKGA